MRDETVAALKALRASKALALDQEKLGAICADIRKCTDEQLWSVIAPKATKSKKPADPLVTGVKASLEKYKTSAGAKGVRLVEFMLPDRESAPKTMPAAIKLLRTYFKDDEIQTAAKELMAKLVEESGMTVPL